MRACLLGSHHFFCLINIFSIIFVFFCILFTCNILYLTTNDVCVCVCLRDVRVIHTSTGCWCLQRRRSDQRGFSIQAGPCDLFFDFVSFFFVFIILFSSLSLSPPSPLFDPLTCQILLKRTLRHFSRSQSRICRRSVLTFWDPSSGLLSFDYTTFSFWSYFSFF